MKMKIKSKEALDIIVRYENKLIDEKALSDWAAHNIEKGIETESLILLAGLTPSDFNEASVLLKSVISELGLRWPTKNLLGLAYAKIIAKDILEGRIQPNDGCAMIGEINFDLDWPTELSSFGMLSHEQTDHESIGITSESVIPEIMSAAKELANLKIEL